MSQKSSHPSTPMFGRGFDGVDSMSPRAEIDAKIREIVAAEKAEGLHPVDQGYLEHLRKIRKVATESGGFQPPPGK